MTGTNPLKFIPVEVRKVQSMDKDSKEYKEAIKALRLNNRAYVYSMINQSEPGEISFFFRNKYRRHLFLTFAFLALMLIVLVIGFILIGQTANEEITKQDIIKLTILISILVLIFSVAMSFALKARGIMDNCLEALIEQTYIRSSHFSDELLSLMSSAYFYVEEGQDIKNNEEKCGCFNCLKIFIGKEIKDPNYEGITCPYCGSEHVIAESSGYPITNDFLSAMKEYWIDSSN